MMDKHLFKGFIDYLTNSDDPNLKKDDAFYLFNSFDAWKSEGGVDIPKNDIILKELKINKMMANP